MGEGDAGFPIGGNVEYIKTVRIGCGAKGASSYVYIGKGHLVPVQDNSRNGSGLCNARTVAQYKKSEKNVAKSQKSLFSKKRCC